MSNVEMGWITAAFCVAVGLIAFLPTVTLLRRSAALRNRLAHVQESSVFIQLPLLNAESERIAAALPRIVQQIARAATATSNIRSQLDALRMPQAFRALGQAASSVKLLLTVLH